MDGFPSRRHERCPPFDGHPHVPLAGLHQAFVAGQIALHVIAIVLIRSVTALQTDTAAALAEAQPADPVLPQS